MSNELKYSTVFNVITTHMLLVGNRWFGELVLKINLLLVFEKKHQYVSKREKLFQFDTDAILCSFIDNTPVSMLPAATAITAASAASPEPKSTFWHNY